MSKAQKTTTGWRRRYLVSSKRDGKWDWYVLPDHQFLPQRNMFEARERDQMLAHVAAIRLGGYSLLGEVPSW